MFYLSNIIHNFYINLLTIIMIISFKKKILTCSHQFYQMFAFEIFLVLYMHDFFFDQVDESNHPNNYKIRLFNLCIYFNNIRLPTNWDFNSYDFGHLKVNSNQSFFVSIHPKPGKKSVLYSKCGFVLSIRFNLPLSFQADTHINDESVWRIGYVPKKYSKKSGDISKSSVIILLIN